MRLIFALCKAYDDLHAQKNRSLMFHSFQNLIWVLLSLLFVFMILVFNDLLFRCPSYHQIGPYNSVCTFSSFPSNLSVRMLKAFFPTSSPCCSTVVSFGSVLLGNGSVGETANGDLVRHFEPHQFAGVQDTCRRFVIDRKEAVRTIVAFQ